MLIRYAVGWDGEVLVAASRGTLERTPTTWLEEAEVSVEVEDARYARRGDWMEDNVTGKPMEASVAAIVAASIGAVWGTSPNYRVVPAGRNEPDVEILDGPLGSGLLEIKANPAFWLNGRIAVEYQAMGMIPTGISTTTADWWADVIPSGDDGGVPYCVILQRVPRVRGVVHWLREVCEDEGVLDQVSDVWGGGGERGGQRTKSVCFPPRLYWR